KALTYAPTGGIVAAPTTSLPEWIGGVRNWDYRYCWLRDATLTLLAFIHADHVDEAIDWRRWLLRAVAGDPADLQIMYGVRGERRHFVHSKVMAWVAFDRAVRSVEEHDLDGPVDHWRALRDEIHAEVCERGFDESLGSFVQSYGSRELDASLLLVPLVGFL